MNPQVGTVVGGNVREVTPRQIEVTKGVTVNAMVRGV